MGTDKRAGARSLPAHHSQHRLTCRDPYVAGGGHCSCPQQLRTMGGIPLNWHGVHLNKKSSE